MTLANHFSDKVGVTIFTFPKLLLGLNEVRHLELHAESDTEKALVSTSVLHLLLVGLQSTLSHVQIKKLK